MIIISIDALQPFVTSSLSSIKPMNYLRRFLSREILSRQETAQLVKAKQDENYHGHIYLGNMYMALGHLDKAESEFSRAQALRFSADVQSKLIDIRHQRQALRPSPVIRPALDAFRAA